MKRIALLLLTAVMIITLTANLAPVALAAGDDYVYEPDPNNKYTGGVGFGQWKTAVSYSSIEVTNNVDGHVLLREEFNDSDLSKWNYCSRSNGDWDASNTDDWAVEDGSINFYNYGVKGATIWTGDPNWGNYTITVKGTVLDGEEGLVVYFCVTDPSNYYFFNMGGYSNTVAYCKWLQNGESGNTEHVPCTLTYGEEYTVKVVVESDSVTGYVNDEELFHMIAPSSETTDEPAAPASSEPVYVEELLKSAEMYLKFDDSYADANGKVEVQVDGENPRFVEGKFGKAASLVSGESTLFTKDLKFGADSFSVTTWVNMQIHSGDPCFFANKNWDAGKNVGFALAILDTDWRYCSNAEGGSKTANVYPFGDAGIDAAGDEWYHIALVVDREAEVYYLYINGEKQGDAGISFAGLGHEGNSYDSEYPFYIGEDGTGEYTIRNGSSHLEVYVDEFAVFSKALSAEEVTAIYTGEDVINAETPATPTYPAPGFATAEDAIASIGKIAITGVTANGGTDHFGDESPDNLWDGNTATKFCTNSLPAIAYMTLDGMYSFDGVAIATANDNAAYGRIPTSWTLSGSNDGENWEVFYTGDDSMFEKVDFTYFAAAFDASASYSQVKFEIASSTDDVVQVSEVVLTGTRTGDLPADEPAAPTYTYPASGESGNFLSGTVIGNATGWDGTEGSGASAAFDGNPASYFDPPSKGGVNWCGMDFGKKIVLEKVVILSRENWNARFNGATIDGSNDGVNWTTLYQASGEGTNPDYYVITEFENNTGYSMYRYHNEVEHGDVAEIEFYGTDAPAEEAPTSSPVDEELEAKAEAPNTFDFGVIAAVAAVISLAGFAAAKKKH